MPNWIALVVLQFAILQKGDLPMLLQAGFPEACSNLERGLGRKLQPRFELRLCACPRQVSQAFDHGGHWDSLSKIPLTKPPKPRFAKGQVKNCPSIGVTSGPPCPISPQNTFWGRGLRL